MNGIAKEVSEDEARQAAEWFAKLPRRSFTRVIETDTVPKTFLGPGRMRFAEPDGSMEPIGNRIITVPEDQERARLRDPNSGFIAYVPLGSLAKGRDLVETGGGEDGRLRRSAMVVRWRVWARCPGSRAASDLHRPSASLVQGRLAQRRRRGVDEAPGPSDLTDEDILAISAYLRFSWPRSDRLLPLQHRLA